MYSFMFLMILSFYFLLSQTSVYPASRMGVGGNPGTILGVFIGKVRERAGKRDGAAGKGIANYFAGFRMTRLRWNGQLKTMGDPSKIKPIWRCHGHIRQAAAR
jgi:hypothetical protein